MKDYFDAWGMLAQGEPSTDGGDSCQRMGMYHFGAVIRERIGVTNIGWPRQHVVFYGLAVSKLMNTKGHLRRHPDATMWYSDWDRASRDQTIPFLCACSAGRTKSLRQYLWKYIRSHAKRLFLFTTNWKPNWVYSEEDTRHIEFDWNPWKRLQFFFGWRPKNDQGVKERVYGTKLPDITLLEFWGIEIRAARLWFLYPLLFICDLETLVSAYFWRYGRKGDNDCLNAVITMVHGNFYYPTPIMWWACKVIDWMTMDIKMEYYFESEIAITPMSRFYYPIFLHMWKKYNQ